MPHFSRFAQSVKTETAFDVLAVARQLKAQGKDVIELEIGDSPFPSATNAARVGIQAIEEGHCHYGPSAGLPEFRAAAAEYVQREYGITATADNVVAGPGAKNFEQLFCEAFVNPDDGVLVFSPHFPTYPPNIDRRGGRVTFAKLKQEHAFRPQASDIQDWMNSDPQPKAVFLNSPHNPTGGVATAEDLEAIADVVRGSELVVFSDEPYDQMAWTEKHRSLLALPGMMEHCVAAYTFSKSFSMSGWRLGYAVSAPPIAAMFAKLTNSSLSCVPPFVQLAGIAALKHDCAERDERMEVFHGKVVRLVNGLNSIDGVHCLKPGGSFYVFPSVAEVCNRLEITSHGLAMYLLEGADDKTGVACLGGECFGEAGVGFLRFSCAEPDERLDQAVAFFQNAIQRTDRVQAYLESHPHHKLQTVG